MDHKSQKRIYFEGAEYFVTFNTQDRIKYFVETIFCEVFIACLRLSKIFYKYDLYAFVVLLEHAHLLLRPEEAKDLSKIMQFLKRHVSRQINYILNFETEEAICKSLLRLGEGKGFKSKKDKILNVSKLNKNLHQKQNKYAEYKELIENHYKLLQRLKGDFNKKYGRDKDVFPKFKWQKSFRDHYIRNHKDFDEHVKYIYNNPVKHKIPKPENYIFIFTNYPELITEI
jgi:REP element-mobilizing transposase RayT